MIGLLILIYLGVFFGNDRIDYKHIEFSLILSALGVVVGSSFVLPKFLLEKEIKNAVEEYASESIEKKAVECIDKKIADAKNDNVKTDAHLSRMIAFGLTEKFPIWSIGWAFRSLKRYVELDANKIGFEDYRDFIEFIRTGIIEKSSAKFWDLCKESEYKATYKNIADEAAEAHDSNPFRPSIRAVKDIADFEYMLVTGKSKALVDYKSLAESLCKSAGKLASVLSIAIINERKNQENEEIRSSKNAQDWLLDEILKISKFGYKDKDIEESEDYKKKLSDTLGKLSETKFCDLKDDSYFFMGKEDESIVK